MIKLERSWIVPALLVILCLRLTALAFAQGCTTDSDCKGITLTNNGLQCNCSCSNCQQSCGSQNMTVTADCICGPGICMFCTWTSAPVYTACTAPSYVGICPPTCGDGNCCGSEDCNTCASDCGSCCAGNQGQNCNCNACSCGGTVQ